jgi:hypothetical protein
MPYEFGTGNMQDFHGKNLERFSYPNCNRLELVGSRIVP